MLFFFMRIFPMPKFKMLCWITMGWTIVSSVVVIFMTTFQCIPIHYNWDGWTGDFVGEHNCLNINALSYAAAASSILQDLVILILPLPIIAGLQMPLRKRIMTLLMFSLGIFIIITSCTRLQSLVAFTKSLNPTWDYVDAVLWTSLEVNISVAVVCLPSVRVIFAQWLPNVFGTLTNHTKKTALGTASTGTGIQQKAHADLADRPSSRVIAVTETWEETSVEMDCKSESASATEDCDCTSQSSGTMTLISAQPNAPDAGIQHSKRCSWWRSSKPLNNEPKDPSP